MISLKQTNETMPSEAAPPVPAAHLRAPTGSSGLPESTSATSHAGSSAAERVPARRRGPAANKLVGRRVSVKALDDLQFYKGTVIRFNYYREGSRHYVRYDDGVEDWEDLSSSRMGSSWNLLPDQDGEAMKDNTSKACLNSTKRLLKDSSTNCKSKKQPSQSKVSQMSSHLKKETSELKAESKHSLVRGKQTPSQKMRSIYRRYKGKDIQPSQLWNAVEKLGGFDFVNSKRNWQNVREEMGLEHSTSSGATLKKCYSDYFIDPGYFREKFDTRKKKSLPEVKSEKSGSELKSGLASESDSDSDSDPDSESDSNSDFSSDEPHTPHHSNVPSSHSTHSHGVSPAQSYSSSSADTFFNGKSQTELIQLARFMTKDKKKLALKGKVIDPGELLVSVVALGGIDAVRKQRIWQKVRADLDLERTTSSGASLNRTFAHYFEETQEEFQFVHGKRMASSPSIGRCTKRPRTQNNRSYNRTIDACVVDVGFVGGAQESSYHAMGIPSFPMAYNFPALPVVNPALIEKRSSCSGNTSSGLPNSPVTQQSEVTSKKSLSSDHTEGFVSLYPIATNEDNTTSKLWSPTPLWDISPQSNSSTSTQDLKDETQSVHLNSTGNVNRRRIMTGNDLQLLQQMLFAELDNVSQVEILESPHAAGEPRLQSIGPRYASPTLF